MIQTKNKFLIAKYIDDNQNNIIAKYKQDMPISEIAELYGVSHSVIYLRLVKWGIRIKKYAGARRRRVEKPRKRYKRKFSPELLVKMKENSRVNDKHISYVEFERSTYDQKLVCNIIDHPILG